MNRKYHIVEMNKQGNPILWVRTLTQRSAYEQLLALKKRFADKKFYIEVK